ncbi:MAG: DUF6463 family protein [Myxococcota bacterium]
MPGLFGLILIALGAIHTVVGLILGRAWLKEIVANGLGSVSLRHPGRMALLWFLWAGFAWMIAGHHLFWLERTHGIPAPRFVVWELLAYAVVGTLLQPRSGFIGLAAIMGAWLLFA